MPFSVYDYYACVCDPACKRYRSGEVNYVLVSACVCDPACKRYRSGEINYVCGYRCQCMFVFAIANKLGFFFFFSCGLWLFCCNLLTYFVSLVIKNSLVSLM